VIAPGVFNLLLPSHIRLLKHGKKIGKLIVALNSDESVERIKGKKPETPFNWRKEVLESLDCVDEVVVNDKDNISDLIKETRANWVLKGDNYDEQTVRKNDGVPDDVGIILFPFLKEYEK
jgi:cytidyltransferase-like protein